MLIFSLDEYGDFEGLRDEKAPVYIAGIIYDDDGDDRDAGIERNRIRAYYEAVIRDAAGASADPSAFSYPEALHSDGKKQRDHDVVRPVKQRVNSTLTEFIREGTYGGRPLEFEDQDGIDRMFAKRRGRYYLFVMLKSDAGMVRLLGDNVGILAKDDYAGNLYFHMAGELLSRLVFYDPVIRNVQEIALDIATRTSPDFAPDDPMVREYIRLGYQPKKVREGDPKSPVYFSLTNADIYRSVLSKEILDSGKTNIVIRDFRVRPINYRSKAAEKKMEFLYMADSLCSLLGYGLKQSGGGADAWLSGIRSRAKQLTGRYDDLIFGYDEINQVFSQAWKHCEEGDLYRALSLAYDGRMVQGTFADLYREVWFKKLEERAAECRSLNDFRMAVSRFHEALSRNAVDQDKCIYMLGVFEKILPAVEKRFHGPEARRILYTFYDACVSAYCHIGDSQKAAEYFDKCREHAGLVSLEDYMDTRNKMVTYLCGEFDFEKALSLAEENQQYQGALNDMRAGIRLQASGAMDDPAMGRAVSRTGQVQAFLRQPEAEETFRRALSFFERDSADYKNVQACLLLHLMDMGEWAAFQSEAIDYFGDCMAAGRQLEYILDEGCKDESPINIKTALYVFVRGLSVFSSSGLSDDLWEKLQHIEEYLGRKTGNPDYRLTGHPAELIFKYLRLIAISRGEDDLQKMFAERARTCLEYSGPTEEVIVRFGEVFCASALGDIQLRDRLSRQLCEYMRTHFPVLALEDIPEDGVQRYMRLNGRITFMHR